MSRVDRAGYRVVYSGLHRPSPIDTTDMANRINLAPHTALGGAILCLVVIGGCAGNGDGSGGGSPRSQPRAVKGYVQAIEAKQRGDTQGAIRALEGATAANPDLTMARDMLGDLYRAGGQYEKASEQYEALVQLDPYTALNHY